MFKVLILLFAILFALSMYIVKPISAGGDQVRGDNAIGNPTQTCAVPDYITGECPYGDYDPFDGPTE